MGDDDTRTIVFTVFTLFLFFSFVSFVPAELYSGDSSFNARNPNIYSGFNLVTDYAYTAEFVINSSTLATYDYSGVYVYYFETDTFGWYMAVTPAYDSVFFGRSNIWWGVNFGNDPARFWCNGTDRGLYLDAWELNLDYTLNEGSLNYEIIIEKDESVTADLVFYYNTTTYSSPSQALLNEELSVFVGVGFDEDVTVFNVWNLIIAIMLFRSPNITGWINVLIAFPLWVLFVVGLFKIVIKIIHG